MTPATCPLALAPCPACTCHPTCQTPDPCLCLASPFGLTLTPLPARHPHLHIACPPRVTLPATTDTPPHPHPLPHRQHLCRGGTFCFLLHTPYHHCPYHTPPLPCPTTPTHCSPALPFPSPNPYTTFSPQPPPFYPHRFGLVCVNTNPVGSAVGTGQPCSLVAFVLTVLPSLDSWFLPSHPTPATCAVGQWDRTFWPSPIPPASYHPAQPSTTYQPCMPNYPTTTLPPAFPFSLPSLPPTSLGSTYPTQTYPSLPWLPALPTLPSCSWFNPSPTHSRPHPTPCLLPFPPPTTPPQPPCYYSPFPPPPPPPQPQH